MEGKMPTDDPELIKKMLQDPDFAGRFKKLSEISEGLAPLFAELPDYPVDLIAKEKFKITPELLKQVMEKAIEVMNGLEWEKGDSSKTQTISDTFVGIVANLELKKRSSALAHSCGSLWFGTVS